MARLRSEPNGDLCDQRSQQIYRHYAESLRLVQQRVDDLPLDQAEDDERLRVCRLRDHAAQLALVPDATEDAQAPPVVELQHRRAYRSRTGVPCAIRDHEDIRR